MDQRKSEVDPDLRELAVIQLLQGTMRIKKQVEKRIWMMMRKITMPINVPGTTKT